MASQDADALLQSFLAAADETQSQELLNRLICDFAEPIIISIIRNKLRTTLRHACWGQCADDLEDLKGSIYVQLLTRLANFKTNCHEDAIRNFCGYIAVMTTNACNEYLRRKYPQRQSLKNRLRYLLSHDKNLNRLRELRENPEAFIQELSGAEVPLTQLSDLLPVIFNGLTVPIKLDELVAIVADLLGVKDRQIETAEIDASQHEVCFEASFAGTIEQREYLRYLWNEIIHLPSRQRTALLLNLRAAEGRDVIALFPLTQTASIRQIADAVNIPPDQFANLWRQLPLDDAAIAEQLGVTRQQVINLRKAARKRLARKGKIFSQR
jgi:RNA polymerase sigma factor (sigma-70 family)